MNIIGPKNLEIDLLLFDVKVNVRKCTQFTIRYRRYVI